METSTWQGMGCTCVPCRISQPEIRGMELLWISSNGKCELLFVGLMARSVLGPVLNKELGLTDARGFAVVL